MSQPAFPQLRSLTLAAGGQPLRLRVLLPPNLAAVAARGGTIAVKAEFDAAGAILPPERLGKGPWEPDPQTFLAALLIESWCGGKLPGVLQLDAGQLSQLLRPLEGSASVFWLKAPQEPIPWAGGALVGVHEHLRSSATSASASPASARAGATAAPTRAPASSSARASASAFGSAAAHESAATAATFSTDPTQLANPSATLLPPMERDLTPLEIDGSTQFLALRLPSRESALHTHALELVKERGFQLEPSNGRWWLRDRHKTLQFLADFLPVLQTQYSARFTDNFLERSGNLRQACIDLQVTATTPQGSTHFDIELALSAAGLDEPALQQALDKGQYYVEASAPSQRRDARTGTGSRAGFGNQIGGGHHTGVSHAGNRVGTAGAADAGAFILVPPAVRESLLTVQHALGAPLHQGLRTRFRCRVSREEIPVAQTALRLLEPSGIFATTADTSSGASSVAASRSNAAGTFSRLQASSSASAPAATDAEPLFKPAASPTENNSRSASRSNRSEGIVPDTRRRPRSTSAARDSHGTRESDDTPDAPSDLLLRKLPAQWLALSRALEDTASLQACPMPPELAAQLRPYQQIGSAWLWHLYRSGLGGILADEMGLGKTVQCLGFLSAVQAASPSAATASAPSVVVCPASLVENWRREAARFTPHLRVFCHHGNSRLRTPAEAAQYDLVITSYGTLLRDQSLFETIPFRVAVADEAQQIKNAKTRNARALRALRAPGRFLLTGTPVENNLRELQSLFAFILPGYLDGEARRGSLAGAAAATSGAAQTSERERLRLIECAAPYILRRMKQSVARELPEKIEQVVYCELEAQQQAFYRQVQVSARRAVQELELELGGAGKGRIHMAALTELLRLRQACIDPRLIDPEESIGSAKRDALLELLEEAVSGGHRVLIFSQFTAALQLVAADIEAMGLRHFYLDGQTKNRTELCERFNADAMVSVFLISLKAGGTGLNLTGADTVIHLDPWWNPAAQAQATDRAHRIGQQRVVSVYQLIAAGTVEEKVLALQREKAVLLEQLLEASDAASASVSLGDLKALIED